MRIASSGGALATAGGALALGLVVASPAVAQTEWQIEHKLPETSMSKFHDLASSAEDNAWAVGRAGEENDPTAYRYDGSAWQEVQVPLGDGYWLTEVATTSADSAWVVAAHDAGDTVLQWDGSTWTKHRFNGTPGGDVAALGDDAWYVSGVAGDSGVVRHFDGQDWATTELPGSPDSVDSIEVRAADDILVVGTRNEQPYSAHYDGQEWQRRAMPKVTPPDGAEEFAISMPGVASTSDGTAWAIGYASWDQGYESLLYKFDGTKWRKAEKPDTGEFSDVMLDVATGPAGKVWLVPDQGSYVFQRQGGDWTRSTLPDDPPGTGTTLTSLTAADGQMWAAGSAATSDIDFHAVVYRAG